ncbi:hypothetical protein N7540_000254 [Penicillium herquei]|nr:hypothetical protein N7540_000254 [Penicillium herquei]
MGYYDEDQPDISGTPKGTEKLCSTISVGDVLLLQGRPCHVTGISGPNAAGQYRYTGIDIMSKQCNEEFSIASASKIPIRVLATAPEFKEWPFLDLKDGHATVMDTYGQSGRCETQFETKEAIGVIICDGGRYFIVDMKPDTNNLG